MWIYVERTVKINLLYASFQVKDGLTGYQKAAENDACLTYLMCTYIGQWTDCWRFGGLCSGRVFITRRMAACHVSTSVCGCSVKMVLMWSAGDIFKTLYFVLRHTPAQFWLCGSAQVLIDMAIMLQVFYYGASSSPVLHRRSPDSNFDSILATS